MTVAVEFGWEGNRRSDIALAIHYRLSDISSYGLTGLRNGRWSRVVWWLSGRALDLRWQVAVQFPAGPLSRNIGQLSLASPGVAKSSTCFGWGSDYCRVAGNTVWVIPYSCEFPVTVWQSFLQTAIHLLYFTFTFPLPYPTYTPPLPLCLVLCQSSAVKLQMLHLHTANTPCRGQNYQAHCPSGLSRLL